MALRDVGYKPFQGQRGSPARNTWVVFRYGLARGWASWTLRLCLLFGWIPSVVGMAWLSLLMFARKKALPEAADSTARTLASVLEWQMWLFVVPAVAVTAAGVVAEDRSRRMLLFFFTKPLRPVQYVAGRTLAVVCWCFGLLALPSMFLALAGFALAPPGERLRELAALGPGLAFSVVCAASLTLTALAASTLGTERMVTLAAWLAFLILPLGLGATLDVIADWPWLKLVSLPALLAVLRDAWFGGEPSGSVGWPLALGVLVAVCVAGYGWTLTQVRRTELH